ncbi:PIN-like domain-containing protein [Enterobacter hormaechei]|uniref:PIN-like domain-containing protein n=1 Tax=Enterobacter hormaechei TaxID=158836 RepID=UPI0007912420|nr:PIN-like domain-containing protein [Enterobacter hormaechei]CZV49073.1 Uncharacterised protein [Enterobacter hormaechei]
MKQQFAGFYGPSEKQIDTAYKDKKTLFVFDTNILLSLYRCEESTRLQFLEVWRNLKDQVWIPFNVCLEYQRNRLTVINDSRSSLNSVNKALIAGIEKIYADFEKDYSIRDTLSRYSNLRTELFELKDTLLKSASDFTEKSIHSRRNRIDFINNHDELRDVIDELTSGCIGEEPSQKFIDEVNKIGSVRYKYMTGPGYADAKDKQNERFSFNGINYDAQYGDLYIWQQIIDKAKKMKCKHVVYVTNDEKEDFVFKINGKKRGPSESLVTEIKKETDVNVFLLHQIDSFLHHAVKSRNAKIDEPSITELSSAATSTLTSLADMIPGFGLSSSLINETFKRFDFKSTVNALENRKTVLLDHINELNIRITELESMDYSSAHSAVIDSLENEKIMAYTELKALRNELSKINKELIIIQKPSFEAK